MKGLSKEERAATLPAFLADESPELTPVDRSTLEWWTECPAKAELLESGKINNNSKLAASGNEVHSALSQTVTEILDLYSQGADITPSEIADHLTGFLYGSRPDVQPDAIKGMRASLWAWAKLMASRSPANILAYDGGDGKRNGQLAYDFPDLGVRVTSEVDLLLATPSIEQVEELDYKSGHKPWTAAMVKEAFQFQLHALLILHKYPKVNSVICRVWSTRLNALTYRVEFDRDDLPMILARVRYAVAMRRAYHGKPVGMIPKWPTVEKCGLCPAASQCPAAGLDASLVATDAGAYLDETVALQAKLDAMWAALSSHVDKLGHDLISETGNAYGIGKPKKASKPKKAAYEVKLDRESEDSEEE